MCCVDGHASNIGRAESLNFQVLIFPGIVVRENLPRYKLAQRSSWADELTRNFYLPNVIPLTSEVRSPIFKILRAIR